MSNFYDKNRISVCAKTLEPDCLLRFQLDGERLFGTSTRGNPMIEMAAAKRVGWNPQCRR
jgi:hypothetical protein